MPSHAGQVSLPGGEREPGETIEEAALRECREELGETGADVEVLGRLSQVYVFASNYLVTPCVAWTSKRPDFRPNPAEVANLLEPTVVELLDPQRRGRHTIERRGVRFRAPHVMCDEHPIWGATNLILAELLTIIAAGRS
jgi:8-oxo-dGTP pyrophosphatase MutT (NUDIX family)